jgi:hypothetical protein
VTGAGECGGEIHRSGEVHRKSRTDRADEVSCRSFFHLDERAMRQNSISNPIWICFVDERPRRIEFRYDTARDALLRTRESISQSVSSRSPPPRISRHELCPIRSRHTKLTENAQAAPRSGRGTCITVEMGTIRLSRTLASCTHSSRMSRCTAKRPLAAPTRGPTDSESSPVASGCMSACHGLSYSLIT